MTIREIYEEYGQIHEDDCAINNDEGSDDGCTCVVKTMVEEIVEYLSHDIDFDNDEQRKNAVKMYLE